MLGKLYYTQILGYNEGSVRLYCLLSSQSMTMTLQFKTRHYNGIFLRELTSVYSFAIAKSVLTSVSASVYYFSSFV